MFHRTDIAPARGTYDARRAAMRCDAMAGEENFINYDKYVYCHGAKIGINQTMVCAAAGSQLHPRRRHRQVIIHLTTGQRGLVFRDWGWDASKAKNLTRERHILKTKRWRCLERSKNA